jgi:heterodisulfide reductase subunit D
MREIPENPPEKADVLYWAGCNTTLRSGVRGTASATVRALKAAGVNTTLLGGREGCCGFSLIAGGLFEEAKRNAEHVVKVVVEKHVETLVTSCSGCYETFVGLYPTRLGVEMPCKVLHSSQLLEPIVRNDELTLNSLPLRVSYHDPCGLGRHCGIYEPPRKLLETIPQLELIEPDLSRERSRCCGGGGGFWGVNVNASMNLAHLRIKEDILPLSADALAVACPMCHTNFLYTMKRQAINMRVYDIMELVDMALREDTVDSGTIRA